MSTAKRIPFLNSSLVRYLITGGVGFAVEILIILLFVHVLRTSAVIAVAVSFWVGLVASFLMQKLFTFKNADHTTKALTKQTFLFAVLVAVNYIFTLVFVAIVNPILDMPTITRACALLITTAWNYFVYKHIIFRK